jgi:hypothetical protein
MHHFQVLAMKLSDLTNALEHGEISSDMGQTRTAEVISEFHDVIRHLTERHNENVRSGRYELSPREEAKYDQLLQWVDVALSEHRISAVTLWDILENGRGFMLTTAFH